MPNNGGAEKKASRCAEQYQTGQKGLLLGGPAAGTPDRDLGNDVKHRAYNILAIDLGSVHGRLEASTRPALPLPSFWLPVRPEPATRRLWGALRQSRRLLPSTMTASPR